MTRSRMTAAATFAHLLGFAKRADEEDDDKDKVRRAEESDDDDDKDEEKSRKAKRAEEDDLEDDEDDKKARKAKGEDDDPDDKDDVKVRKAKRAESDDDDDPDAEEDDDQDDPKSTKAAVAKERARCAQIMAHGLKSGNAEQAGVFAFDTNMTASAAISALNAAGSISGRGGNLKDRMASARIPNAGAGADGGEPSNLSSIAQKIIAAAARAKPQ